MSQASNAQLAMIKTNYTRVLIDAFSKHGINIPELLNDSGLPPDLFYSDSDYLPSEPVKRMLYLLAEKIGTHRFCEVLRLSFQQHIIPSILPFFNKYTTVKEALDHVNEIYAYDSPGSQITTAEEHKFYWFKRHARYENSPYYIWGEVFCVLYIIELISALTHKPWLPAQIKIQHSTADLLASYFPNNIQFFIAQPFTALLVDEKTLLSSISSSHKKEHNNEPIIEWHTSFSDSVFTLLLPYVKEHTLTIGNAAKLLKMSPRTFQRRLQNENTSFRKIKESLLLSVSCEMMEQGYSLTYIANQLGYTHLSHFSRAFKQVTGVTPKHYRTSLLSLLT